jgi:RNA-directed DNA polymerase
MADRKAPQGTHRQQPASEAWDMLPWQKLERHVFRIQKRIYRARQRGNTRAVQKLQKLLMKSEAARLLAVRRVTRTTESEQAATGAGTHRVHACQQFAMVGQLHPRRKAQRARIPARAQGLSTPCVRARQALVSAALAPEWEAIFAAGPAGPGPGCSCQDAIKAIYQHIRDQPQYVFVAGIRHGFATINHNKLLAKLQGSASMRRMVRVWLRAGIMHDLSSTSATNGTPQGEPLPLLLAHIALYGIKQAVKPADLQGYDGEHPLLIGYADHFVLLHSRLADVATAASRAEAWLNDLGLHLDPAQTYITHTLTPHQGRVGFTFAGYALRHYPTGRPTGCKTVLKPGKQAIRGHLQALGKSIRACRAASQETLIRELNPLIEEWAHFYRLATSADAHARCDHILHQQLLSWARHRHPKKGMTWLISKYWPDVRAGRNWTFCSDRACIRRHKEIINRSLHLSQHLADPPSSCSQGSTTPAVIGQESTGRQHALTLQSGTRRTEPPGVPTRHCRAGIKHT